MQYKNKEAAAMHPESVASGNIGHLQNTFGANENKTQGAPAAQSSQEKPSGLAIPKLKLG